MKPSKEINKYHYVEANKIITKDILIKCLVKDLITEIEKQVK